MSFNGKEGEFITLETAISWTANYRNSDGYTGVKAQFYGIEKLKKILDQPNCVGIRIYNAIDDNGNHVKVLVGTDANENDLSNGLILERGLGCPIYCGGGGGVTNPLQG